MENIIWAHKKKHMDSIQTIQNKWESRAYENIGKLIKM
jgi:hypothetical protein